MILWVILIIIAIIFLIALWWYTGNPSQENIPTMHARCKENSTCGGDLTCDVNCRRCKKTKGGDCANDVDCETGLKCQQWKCLPPQSEIPSEPPTIKKPTRSERRVHWDETKNQIFSI